MSKGYWDELITKGVEMTEDLAKEEDLLFMQFQESLYANVERDFKEHIAERVDDLYRDWKEEIVNHDAFFIMKDELITVDVIDPDNNHDVILFFFHGKKRIAEYVESLSWFVGNDTRQVEFECWRTGMECHDVETFDRLMDKIKKYLGSIHKS